MSLLSPRLRVFAGPNGSGKSTIKEMLPEASLGVYEKAQQAGFRTYLYFVATEDPQINVSRVQHRVETGGHSVPPDKIVSRYARSLDLLSDAVTYANRAYIFDNSGHARVWIAEVTEGESIEIKTDQMPAWFKTALWDKFDTSDDLAAM